MKQIECSGPYCPQRRIHYEDPFTPRGPQFIEVPDDYEGKAYCSIECAMYDGCFKKDPKPS